MSFAVWSETASRTSGNEDLCGVRKREIMAKYFSSGNIAGLRRYYTEA